MTDSAPVPLPRSVAECDDRLRSLSAQKQTWTDAQRHALIARWDGLVSSVLDLRDSYRRAGVE